MFAQKPLLSANRASLAADGLRKAAEGVTSVAEVARLLPDSP